MKNKMWKIAIIVIFVVGSMGVFILKKNAKTMAPEVVKEITPSIGSIENVIATTGTVLPKNRLEIKPPVNGRIESVLVKEGEKIKVGQILGWMSSTERAALLDNARGQGADALKYWEDAYKPIPLLAPIEGEVIVATTQPGQTVTTTDAIIVLSDHLIVRAQVDETDIGKVVLGQKAIVSLDAYPDVKIKALVEHIYYESQTVNNVTVYQVDLIPEEIPSFFRSGMNANINFVIQGKDNVVLVPRECVQQDQEGSFVFVSQGNGQEPARRAVKVGMADDKKIEIISGVSTDDSLILKAKKYMLPKSVATGSNPFMPQRRR